jgi:hypothetical protein
MSYVEVEVKLVATCCCVCGIFFGLPDFLDKQLKTKGTSFYCPNGHILSYTDPELKKVKRQLELYKQWYAAEQEDHEATRRSLRATKGVLTRTKNRIAAGVCPCCRRHFENLERHIVTKHPDYAAE